MSASEQSQELLQGSVIMLRTSLGARSLMSDDVQDLSFKDTLVKLKQQFHQLSRDEVVQYLDASAGNYHTAFALIQQCLGEDLHEQVRRLVCNHCHAS